MNHSRFEVSLCIVEKSIPKNIFACSYLLFTIFIDCFANSSFLQRLFLIISVAGHILSRVYNCTKYNNRPIDNATTARFILAHFSSAQFTINFYLTLLSHLMLLPYVSVSSDWLTYLEVLILSLRGTLFTPHKLFLDYFELPKLLPKMTSYN